MLSYILWHLNLVNLVELEMLCIVIQVSNPCDSCYAILLNYLLREWTTDWFWVILFLLKCRFIFPSIILSSYLSTYWKGVSPKKWVLLNYSLFFEPIKCLFVIVFLNKYTTYLSTFNLIIEHLSIILSCFLIKYLK